MENKLDPRYTQDNKPRDGTAHNTMLKFYIQQRRRKPKKFILSRQNDPINSGMNFWLFSPIYTKKKKHSRN